MDERATPGPWQAIPNGNRYRITSHWEGHETDQQHLVAEIVENREGPAATRANAALVVQAPRLRDECRHALEVLTRHWDDENARLTAVARLAAVLWPVDHPESAREEVVITRHQSQTAAAGPPAAGVPRRE